MHSGGFASGNKHEEGEKKRREAKEGTKRKEKKKKVDWCRVSAPDRRRNHVTNFRFCKPCDCGLNKQPDLYWL